MMNALNQIGARTAPVAPAADVVMASQPGPQVVVHQPVNVLHQPVNIVNQPVDARQVNLVDAHQVHQ